MKPFRSRLPLSLAALPLMAGCAQSPETAPDQPVNFDDCLITHMAAIAMLDGATSEKDVSLRAAVIASQSKLLADDTIDEDDLAQRTTTLMQSYAPGADAAIVEAKAIGTPPIFIAAQAILCGQELSQ